MPPQDQPEGAQYPDPGPRPHVIRGGNPRPGSLSVGVVLGRLGALEYLLSGSVAVGVRCAPPNLQGFVAQDKHFHGLFALQQLRYDAAVMSHHLFHLGVLLGRDANAKPFTWSHKAQT